MKIYYTIFQEHLTNVDHYMLITEDLNLVEKFLKDNKEKLEKDDGFTYLEIWEKGKYISRERKI